ncbi:transposable element Tcb1 transposase [Trichonephila clavipes]|nr:transposable element Tcb1 transposase [Trichonephila clavipes]
MALVPLTLHHRQERLQLCDQRRTWAQEWREVIFSDESRFCFESQDGRIGVWWHRGECKLAECIRNRHTGPSPGVILWGAIRYTSRSPLVHSDGTFNSAHYISAVLRPVALPVIRALRNRTFQKENARPHGADIVRTFLETENVRLLPWPARSPDQCQFKLISGPGRRRSTDPLRVGRLKFITRKPLVKSTLSGPFRILPGLWIPSPSAQWINRLCPRSFANRKRLVHDCRRTSSSLYASCYG